MPIYEYRCSACGETVEKIQSQAKTEIPCPSCDGMAQRSVSVFASAAGSDSSGGGCMAPPGSGFG